MSSPMAPVGTRPTPPASEGGSPTDGRLSVLLWLACRALPPLDRDDLRMLVRVAAACAYLAMPLTIALAADRLPEATAVSLLCLSVPGLAPLWRNAIRLGDRRRGTALALRQVRLSHRAATLTSLGRQVTYPLLGALLGVPLILMLRGPLSSILPNTAPLAVAVKQSAADWTYAASLAALSLIGLTALLGSVPATATGRWIGRILSRIDRREAEPQPQ